MKKWIFISGILLSLILFSTCQKEALTNINDETSEELCRAILEEDLETVKDIFEELLLDLEPSPANHPDAHKENLNTLVNRLNTSNCLIVTDTCYACGLSLPPYSSISVDLNFEGIQTSRVLLILTPMDDLMNFMSIQE